MPLPQPPPLLGYCQVNNSIVKSSCGNRTLLYYTDPIRIPTTVLNSSSGYAVYHELWPKQAMGQAGDGIDRGVTELILQLLPSLRTVVDVGASEASLIHGEQDPNQA